MAGEQVAGQRDDSASFIDFADLCEKVRSTRSKLSKVASVADYFLKLHSESDLRIAATFLSGRVFPPGTEREANVGYSLIWKTFTSFLGIDDDKLSSFYRRHGDLGSAIEDALREPRSNSSSGMLFRTDLSLQDVFATFRELAGASGKGSQDKRKQILTRLFASSKDPIEAKYTVRLLAGEMRIGLVEGLVEESIAKAYSTTLEETRAARLVTGDIGLVAVLARRGRLSDATIELFRPTSFMLADSAENAEEMQEKFEGKPVSAEYKYDGIRAQIHAKNDRVKIYSRNLEDITPFFPELESSASDMNLPGAILDGEIIAFEKGTPLPFQALQRRLRKIQRSAEDAPIKYFAFDILFHENSLIEKPLSFRNRILHSLDLKGCLTFSKQRTVSTANEMQQFFEESKSQGYEGLVVKEPVSTYTPGRRGMSWVKLKKELDTLDVVIVGAEYGHGKRAGVISDYTFAVRDGTDLRVVGKAYSGLTDLEIDEMTEQLKNITLEDHGYRRTVRPKIILEVAFDAIQKSDRHGSGYALRFPRIKRIRIDKSVEEIDTLERVRQIYEGQIVKL